MTKTQQQILVEFRSKWGDRFDYSHIEYRGSEEKVKIICADHGEFWLLPWQHNRMAGCYRCGREQVGRKTAAKTAKTTEQFVVEAKERFGDRYDYSKVKYVQSFVKVIIGCREHGDFELAPSRHLFDYRGCPTCCSQKSNIEGLWLDSVNIPRDSKHRNINLPFIEGKCLIDGFNPETNTVYEFHGDFWHGNPTKYKASDVHPLIGKPYGLLYEETLAKEQRIKSAGYNLVVMWESDWRKSICRSTPAYQRLVQR